MTNAQLWISVAIPSLLIILAWFQTNVRLSDLKSNIIDKFAEVDRRLSRLEADYKEFYGLERKLEGRVDELSKR